MPPIDKYHSNFRYWGRRKYVHGSHMIYGLMDAADAWKIAPVLTMSAYFREPLRSQGVYCLYGSIKEAREDGGDFHSVFQIAAKTGKFAVGLAADHEREVSETLADNESAIVAGHRIDRQGKSAELKGYAEPLFINAVIALNKKLLNELFPLKSWLMARLDLNLAECASRRGGPIRVELVGVIGNSSTRSTVFLGGDKTGEIFFNGRAAE